VKTTKENLITTEAQLIDLGGCRVVFMGRNKPISGGCSYPRKQHGRFLALESFELSFGGNRQRKYRNEETGRRKVGRKEA